MQEPTITITDYLRSKGIEYKERGGEIVTKCLFNGCDDDSRPNERHLYFAKEGAAPYDCKKCGAKGNIFTLATHLGDEKRSLFTHQNPPFSTIKKVGKKTAEKLTSEIVERCHDALPDRIRAYLNGRGITDDLIAEYRLGFAEFYGVNWITIPIPKKDAPGEYALLKLRRDPEAPENTKEPKMKVWPMGASHELFDWRIFKGTTSLVVCEGELDCLVLLSKGIPAVTSTGGAGTFKKEWVQEFANLESVCVCFDADEPGEAGAARVLEMLKDVETLERSQIHLPADMGEGRKDITDYFSYYKGDPQKFMDLAKKVGYFDPAARIMRVEKLEHPVAFEEWRGTISEHFPDFLFTAETCMSVLAQLLIKDVANPFALVLVDVPASGKTITLNFFDGIKGLTYASDKFTPASFVSNAVNVGRKRLEDIDLLPRIRNQAFLVRDMATMLSKREDDLQECLGILTRVLDGQGLKTDTGVHGERAYVGEYLFMMLAASTPISSRVWRIMGSLGSRLFFLNMNTRDKDEDELAKQLMTTAVKDKERACRIATKRFILTLWHKHQDGIEWDRQGDDGDCIRIITRCAKLLANLRGIVSIYKDHRTENGEAEFDYQPRNIEKPDRIAQLLYNLCRGHAVTCGRARITKEDLRFAIQIALDSAPPGRAKLVNILIQHNGELKTSEVEAFLHCSKTIALKEMKTLEALGVAEIVEAQGMIGQPEKVIRLKEDCRWFMSEECRDLRNR